MILGVDIGGANLKYATADGQTRTTVFPLWLQPDKLESQIVEDIASFGEVCGLAVTMTGELADCFFDRAVGVRAIVESTCRAVEVLSIKQCGFYSVDGEWLSADEAIANCDSVAAANWHAMANWMTTSSARSGLFGAADERPGLMIDIGSTTTDLVPFKPPTISTNARTDFDRLNEGTLIYLGGGRTPICSIVQAFRYQGREVPLMREVFATMDDVRILLGHCPESPEDTASADGKPRDRRHAVNRMARMIGLDHRHVKEGDAIDFARQVHSYVQGVIGRGILSLAERYPFERLLMLGHSRDLVSVPDELDVETIDLRDCLGDEVSRVGPAFALAVLAESMF